MQFINTTWRSTKRKMKSEIKKTVYSSYKDKFMALLVKGGDDECWYVDIGGAADPLDKYCTYGWKAPEDKKCTTYMARKVSYEIFCGPLVDGLFLSSSCKRPGCVNPKHLIVSDKSHISKINYKGTEDE